MKKLYKKIQDRVKVEFYLTLPTICAPYDNEY